MTRTTSFCEASETIHSKISAKNTIKKQPKIKKLIASLNSKNENVRDSFEELLNLLKQKEQQSPAQINKAEIENIIASFKDKDEGYYDAKSGVETEPHLLHTFFEAIKKIDKRGNLNQPVLERLEEIFTADARTIITEQFKELFDSSPKKKTEDYWVEAMLKEGYSREDIVRSLRGERYSYEDDINDIARGKYSKQWSQADWLKETIVVTGKSEQAILREIETAKTEHKTNQQKPAYQLVKNLTEFVKQSAERFPIKKVVSLFIPLGLGLIYLCSVFAAPVLAAIDTPVENNPKVQEKSLLLVSQAENKGPEPTIAMAKKNAPYNMKNPDIDTYLNFVGEQAKAPWKSNGLMAGKSYDFYFPYVSAKQDLEFSHKKMINGVIHNEDIQYKLAIFTHNENGVGITRIMRPDPLDETPPVKRYPIIEFKELDGELIARSDWEYKYFDNLNPHEYSSIEHHLGNDKLKVFDSANSVALEHMTKKIVFDWQYLDKLDWGWANVDDNMVVKKTVNYNTQIEETTIFDEPGDETEPQFGWAKDSDGNRLYEFYWDGFDTVAKRVKYLFYDDGKTAEETYYEIDNDFFPLFRIGWDAEKQEMSRDKWIYTERVNEGSKIGYKIINNPNNSDIKKVSNNPLIKISDSATGVRNLEIYNDPENMELRFAAIMNAESLTSITNIEYAPNGRMIEHSQNIADGSIVDKIFNNPVQKQLIESETKSVQGEIISWSAGHQQEKGQRYKDKLDYEKETVQRTIFDSDGNAVSMVIKRYTGNDLSELKEKLKDAGYFAQLPGEEILLSNSFCNSDGNWIKQTLDLERNLVVIKTTASNRASENSVAKPFITENIAQLKQMLNNNALSGYDGDVVQQTTAVVDSEGHWVETAEDYTKNSKQTNIYNNIISKNFISSKNVNLLNGETNWETKAINEQGDWLRDKQGNPIHLTKFNDNKKQVVLLNRVDGVEQSSRILTSDNKIIWDLSSVDQQSNRLIDEQGNYYIRGESPHTGEIKKITLASIDIDSPNIKVAVSDNSGEKFVSEISEDGYSRINKNVRSKQTERITLAYKNGVGISGIISDKQGDLWHWQIAVNDNGKDVINKQNLRSKEKEKITLSRFGGSPERIGFEGSNKLSTVFKQDGNWLDKEIGAEMKPLAKTLFKNNQVEEYEEKIFSFQGGPKEEVTHYRWSEQQKEFIEILNAKAKDENGNWLIDSEGRHFDEIKFANGEKQIITKFWLGSFPETVATFAPDGKTLLYKQNNYFDETDANWHCDRTNYAFSQTQESNVLLWFDGPKGDGSIIEQRADGDVRFDVQREYSDDYNKIKETIVRCDNQDTNILNYERILGEWEKIGIARADGTGERNVFDEKGIKQKRFTAHKELGRIEQEVEEFSYEGDKIVGVRYERHSPKGDFIGERVYDNLVDKWELKSNYEVLDWGREQELKVYSQPDGTIVHYQHKTGFKIPLLDITIGGEESIKEFDWQYNLISHTDLKKKQKEEFAYLKNDNIKGEICKVSDFQISEKENLFKIIAEKKSAVLDWDYVQQNLYNEQHEKLVNWERLSWGEKLAITIFAISAGLLSAGILLGGKAKGKLGSLFPDKPQSRRKIDTAMIILGFFAPMGILALNPLWNLATVFGITAGFFGLTFFRNLSSDITPLYGKNPLKWREFSFKRDFHWQKFSRSLISCHLGGPVLAFLLLLFTPASINSFITPFYGLSAEAWFGGLFLTLWGAKSGFKAAMRGLQWPKKAQLAEIPKTAVEELVFLSTVYYAFSLDPWLYLIFMRVFCQTLGGGIDAAFSLVSAVEIAPDFRMKMPGEISIEGRNLNPKKIYKAWAKKNKIKEVKIIPATVLKEINGEGTCPMNNGGHCGACFTPSERWHATIGDIKMGFLHKDKYDKREWEEKIREKGLNPSQYKYLSPWHIQYEFLLHLLAKAGIKDTNGFFAEIFMANGVLGCGGKSNNQKIDIWEAIEKNTA